MSRTDFTIPVTFRHRVIFTHDVFEPENPALAEVLREGGGLRALVMIEQSVADAWPHVRIAAAVYLGNLPIACCGVFILPGGEAVKSDDSLVREVWHHVDAMRLDRHSYLLAVGGGAFLDAVGFAAATAHRGVRLLRFPTTTLSQADSGVGVKCAINAFGKKNWIGSFAVPFAVINDFTFLRSQPPQGQLEGLVEAVKVALVKDAEFFQWIESHVGELATLQAGAVEACVRRSALWHARHIAEGGDAFETGSSRPLDFGHWAAHKLESLSDYRCSHGRAVAIGIALDLCYATRAGLAVSGLRERVLCILSALGLEFYHPLLDSCGPDGRRIIFEGIDEFREHLGGKLTVLMPRDVGKFQEIHHIDAEILSQSIQDLHELTQVEPQR